MHFNTKLPQSFNYIRAPTSFDTVVQSKTLGFNDLASRFYTSRFGFPPFFACKSSASVFCNFTGFPFCHRMSAKWYRESEFLKNWLSLARHMTKTAFLLEKKGKTDFHYRWTLGLPAQPRQPRTSCYFLLILCYAILQVLEWSSSITFVLCQISFLHQPEIVVSNISDRLHIWVWILKLTYWNKDENNRKAPRNDDYLLLAYSWLIPDTWQVGYINH